MATILLSAAGAAIGSSVGGSLLGLSMTAVGRFAGATLGRALDQRLMGQGAEAVETGRVDRLRITGAGEGRAVPQAWGRVRLGGHVIWATQFAEHVSTSGGGGKGAPSQPKVRQYSYSVSLAVALCEGVITGVNRVWADGVEIAVTDLNMRVYDGSADQMPDPKMEAVEGAGAVPAYRGTAYVVIEDLMLERFGNRVPQFSFEVVRPVQDDPEEMPFGVRGVALMPGTGEYALATEPVHFDYGAGVSRVANVNTPSGQPDFSTSLKMLGDELPDCGAVSLVVSWFGNDLRCGECHIRPLVEQRLQDASQPWTVAGVARSVAGLVPEEDGRVVYGGTPSDASVLQAIAALKEAGQAVMYYPFILMDQMSENGMQDPWSGAEDQPSLPWRGRITLSVAPGRDGSPDGTAAADAEVAAFFGTAVAGDFAVGDGTVAYTGPIEWGFRRFILHQAALCAAAGGVDAFCIGSEMRSLTQIRGAAGFPAVQALKALAAEVRALLGPSVKIGYAADWSEYFGYHPQDGSGDVYFHLDPLWSDPNIDFVGIDNYMPLSDWRDGADHADADWGTVHDINYLQANVAGGEGYDWYYPSAEARAAQRREPISDGAYGEAWVYRYKDIRNWWGQQHHDRIGGVRQELPTDWEPGSKPVWFTELGCPAVDKGTNQPNVFYDAKSSESALPHYSNGLRDPAIQRAYLKAMHGYWGDPDNNPVSEVYAGPMVDMTRAFVWAWDARPYPWFPNAEDIWSDGANWRRGHWITGRSGHVSLAAVVREICARSGVFDIDVSGLRGVVRGMTVPESGDARGALQPLMLAYGFDAIERDGVLVFRMRDGQRAVALERATLAVHPDVDNDLVEVRTGEAEMAGRVRVGFTEADGDHRVITEETVLPDEATHAVAETELPLALTRAEGRQVVERWLNEARVARDTVRFALPPSQMAVAAGDVVTLPLEGVPARLRVDRVEVTTHQMIEAVRIEEAVYHPSEFPDDAVSLRPVSELAPVLSLFMDLPLMTGQEVAHAPHVAVAARPWPGSVAVYASGTDADYALDLLIAAQSVVGVTRTNLPAHPPGRPDLGPGLEVDLTSGTLSQIDDAALLAGRNLFAIGDGTPGNWELFQARDVALIGDRRWRLEYRLRGQFGSDAAMPESWPAGSYLVAMNGIPVQLPLAAAARGVERHYRVGPAKLSYDSPLYRHLELAFAGNGLRPYRPAHLVVVPGLDGHDVSWIRRTRIDGDPWDAPEVPLGEESERYLLQVRQGGQVLREVTLEAPVWTYSAGMQGADGITGVFEVAVAQVSAKYGAGPFAVATASG
ncbi:glycoside hydrolase/phage tail family protein [Mesobacterium sp. TK19101]|uniref:Glycoside hydrolase/phage tail family protein n=1 Tax=Mesobacterium hydrothermale TaxID=3111907 RepID=A0ABU6HIE3_9RHOB|nr:glycoside hydrolase/phage tail family protein [Mesobacterium sp. TK19101]MEC3862228.1 glycoside hydrolase/phage tail family protein [Mesobacterium sp. TK19101]